VRRIPPGALLLLLAALAAPLAAQRQAIASGTVLRTGAQDTLPLAGAKVVLHRIGRDTQAPLDSTRTDARGRFRFRYAADTSAIFLLSTNHADIEYFSDPVRASAERPDTALVLMVSDTTSRGRADVVSQHVVVSRPDPGGLRGVLEIVVLENAGPLTLVSPDSVTPVWQGRIPAGAAGAVAGSGDYSPDALVFQGDSVRLFAPVAPGTKQLVFTYSLPARPGAVQFTSPDSVGTFNLLLEEDQVEPTGGGLADGGVQEIEGKRFRQWVGPLAAGATVTVPFGGGSTTWVLPALVGAVALVLIAVLVRTLRRKPAPAATLARSELLERLARLDQRYAGREAETPPDEWARYQAERAELKARLAGQLAAKEPVA